MCSPSCSGWHLEKCSMAGSSRARVWVSVCRAREEAGPGSHTLVVQLKSWNDSLVVFGAVS